MPLMNSETDATFWDDIVEVGGPLDTAFGTLRVDDASEQISPRFGGTDLVEGEFGVAIRPDELTKVISFYRVFFENEPVAHRLCRLVFSKDFVRIDADKVSSFLRYTLSTAPINLPSDNVQLVISFDDLVACSAAARQHAAMKVSGHRITYYSDDRFVRPIQTLPLERFVSHCDPVASSAQSQTTVEFDTEEFRKFLDYAELTIVSDPFEKSFIELSNGVARAVGASSYELRHSGLGNLDLAFRPRFARTLRQALRFIHAGELCKTDNHAVVSNQTIQYGFERLAPGHPVVDIGEATNIIRFPFGGFKEFISSSLAGLGDEAAFLVSYNGAKDHCGLTAFDPARLNLEQFSGRQGPGSTIRRKRSVFTSRSPPWHRSLRRCLQRQISRSAFTPSVFCSTSELTTIPLNIFCLSGFPNHDVSTSQRV